VFLFGRGGCLNIVKVSSRWLNTTLKWHNKININLLGEGNDLTEKQLLNI
jgi:hypothetical protein